MLDPQMGKIPLRRKQQPTPIFLPGEFHGQRSYSPQGHKESDMTEVTYHACTYVYMYVYVIVAQSCLDSLQPHGLQPTRLLCPWDPLGKNIGAMPSSRAFSQPRYAWQLTPVFLNGEFHGQRSMGSYDPQGCKDFFPYYFRPRTNNYF